VTVLSDDKTNSHRLTVRRRNIFSDAKRGFARFDESKLLRITFLGESAIDDGGPKREFMILMGAIANNGSIMYGPPNKRLVRHNAAALQVSYFFTVESCSVQ
jgi:hypothetical protein